MYAAVCTLFEGNYHFGVGALTNSLYYQGFRGVVWAGYRGVLPHWAKPLTEGQGYQELSVAEGCVIRFINLTTPKFFTFYKPEFMSQLWESYCPDVEALFYFDPDIVNKCRWGFYEEWVNRGITLCEDGYPEMSRNHPRRLGWLEFVGPRGYTCHQKLDRSYNGGFIGLKQGQKSLLSLWQELTEIFEAEGYLNVSDSHHVGDRARGLYTYPYVRDDQDVLNLALMLTSYPLSTFGPEGMDFGRPGSIMSHSAGSLIKSWQKPMICKALGGVPPTLTDKLYYRSIQTPIQLYSRSKLIQIKIAIRCGAAIGRFVRRNPWG